MHSDGATGGLDAGEPSILLPLPLLAASYALHVRHQLQRSWISLESSMDCIPLVLQTIPEASNDGRYCDGCLIWGPQSRMDDDRGCEAGLSHNDCWHLMDLHFRNGS
jgi:hypothetical protein